MNTQAILEKIKLSNIRIPNALQGRPYEYLIDINSEPFCWMQDFYFEYKPEVGIQFETNNLKFTGIPLLTGESKIVLRYKLQNASKSTPYFEKEIKLIINPDPRTLWKHLESNKNDQYSKPDSDSTAMEVGSKKLIVASKRGRSHAHEALFRDDDFSVWKHPSKGWVVMAVADGAGSAKYSRKGSLLACETVISYFRNIDSDIYLQLETLIRAEILKPDLDKKKFLDSVMVEHLGKAAFEAYTAIKNEASAKNSEIRDYNTTLLFILANQIENKWFVASFWVGDGGIGIYDRQENQVHVMGVPDAGMYAGQTKFLTMSEIFLENAYIPRIKFKILDDFTSIILMTDGISDAKFETEDSMKKPEKWNSLWQDLQGENQDKLKVRFEDDPQIAAADLLDWLDFWSPGNHDDRTIAILY